MSLEATLIKKPYEVSFSGNPIPYVFALSPYTDVERGQDIRLQVRLLIEQSFGSGFFAEVKSQAFYPDGRGLISIDVASIIDPYLEYYTPKPGLVRPVQAIHQRKRFKLSWMLLRNGAIAQGNQETPVASAIKAGLAYAQWHPSEFFTSFVIEEKKPLQYFAKGEKHSKEEPQYLFWTYPYSDNLPQTVHFAIYTEGGTKIETTLASTVIAGKWGVCCAPVGFNQVGLDALLPSNVFPVYYTVQVMAEDTEIVAPYEIHLDHRNFYGARTLIYRNSLGSLETIRLRGQVDFSADYDMQQARRTTPPAYFINMIAMAQTIQWSEESEKFTGETGWLTPEAAQKLRDLFLSDERYDFEHGRLYPIVLNAKAVKFYSNRENLISLQIDYQRAYTNQYFTPEGLMPNGRACPALEHFSVRQVSGSTLQIIWALAIPYDLLQVEVTYASQTETFYLKGNTGVVRQAFANPSTGDPEEITVVGRTVCDEHSFPMSLGPVSTRTLSVTGNALPVANNDFYSVVASALATVLPGSVLDNDYDPDGDPLQVIVASGATAAGGTYSIDAAGKVTYTAPSSVFNGQDQFDYQVVQTGGGLATARVTITVAPGSSTIPGGGNSGIFVRVEEENIRLTFGTDGAHTGHYGEVYIRTYSDPSGTQPLDVTGLNIQINYMKRESLYRTSGWEESFETPYTLEGFGTSQIIYDGTLLSIGQGSRGTTVVREFFLVAGSGYVII